MGAYVAKQDIPWGGVLAYSRGQRVEADAVEANGWQDYVAGEGTKEARAITAEITGRSAEDAETSKSSTSEKSTSRRAANTETQEG